MFTNMWRQRPYFPPIFNRLLPKMRLIPGLCPGTRWGAYSAPQTPSWTNLGHKPILSGSTPCFHIHLPLATPLMVIIECTAKWNMHAQSSYLSVQHRPSSNSSPFSRWCLVGAFRFIQVLFNFKRALLCFAVWSATVDWSYNYGTQPVKRDSRPWFVFTTHESLFIMDGCAI